MAIGWNDIGGKRYYLGERARTDLKLGEMATGTIQIIDKNYTFYGDGSLKGSISCR
ncbi:hypothetical protein ER45_029135 (plasmid) [Bacillus mycoides]|nr:hypothetical protein ER45_029135 [Bacillus mycoides]